MLPPEADVFAYDENMGVLFQWTGCPDVTSVADLPRGGLAGIAISRAHLIRRRDGLVLKGEDPSLQQLSDEIVLPTDEEVKRREGKHLKRVDLIPPPEELVEHEPLTNEQLLKVALWKLLMLTDDEETLVITDADIVRALSTGQISIEKANGEVMFRAHFGDLDVIKVADEVKPKRKARKTSEPGGSNGS